MSKQTCGLCLEEKDLKNSHLMPKALYKIIRNAFDGNDIVLSQQHTLSSLYSNYQETAKFLCEECEQKFSHHGENKVIPECYQGNDNFLLLEKLSKATPIFESNNEKWFNPYTSNFSNINEYLYFALSIIWRSSAWPKAQNSNQKSLGTTYQEMFRQYLLGQQSFPKNVYVGIYVDTDIDLLPMINFPISTKKIGYHHHIFYIPGIKFSLIIGNNPKGVDVLSKEHKTNLFFISYSLRNHADYYFFARKLKTEFKPKGRLAEDFNSWRDD